VIEGIGLWLAELGVWAYVVAPLVMTVVAVLPIPAEAPAMANGVMFGPVMGSLITWIGALAGAWISYEIARSWGRPVAERMVGRVGLEKFDRIAEDAGWWGLIVLRLIPMVAFTALNWGSGLCVVPRGRFLWTTALGIAPGVILFTSTGVGLGALYRRSPTVTVGLVLAVVSAMMLWVYRRRRRMAEG
jgi:uncharacterized membrane protein YdjX (TVP38/TMEM64 family)